MEDTDEQLDELEATLGKTPLAPHNHGEEAGAVSDNPLYKPNSDE